MLTFDRTSYTYINGLALESTKENTSRPEPRLNSILLNYERNKWSTRRSLYLQITMTYFSQTLAYIRMRAYTAVLLLRFRDV